MTELLISDMGFVFIKNFTKSLEILDTILDLAGLVSALVKSLLSSYSAFGLYTELVQV